MIKVSSMNMFWDKSSYPEPESLNFRAAGCFCIVNEQVLLMQRNPKKSYGLHWAIPTGKIEQGESPLECMTRELKEELGIEVPQATLELVGEYIVGLEDSAFEYVAYVVHLGAIPHLKPNPDEVYKFQWVSTGKIQKRKVVPYFYNTVNALLDWEIRRQTEPALFGECEANCVDSRRLRNFRKKRVRRQDTTNADRRLVHSGSRK